jgi:hypothetical protein
MNDGGYRALDQKLSDTYKDGLTHIADNIRAKLPAARLTLIQPSPYDDITREPKFPGGYNEVLLRYGETVKEIAAATRQTTADLNTPLVAVLRKARTADPALAEKIIPDRIHPAAAGGLIMAGALLKSWNAPALVTEVAIDAPAGKVTTAQNTTITDLAAATDDPRAHRLAWTQHDAALPMPLDKNNPALALAVATSDFTDTLNRQHLRITGLTAPDYELSIDGKPIGTYSPAQLAAGINLATLDTPMTAQAAEVHRATLLRANTHNTRWRTYEVPQANPAIPEHIRATYPALIAAHDATDAALATLQHALARPLPRRYELKGPTITQQGRTIAQLPLGNTPNLALNKKWKSSAPNHQGWDKGLTDGTWAGRNPYVYATDGTDTFPKTVTIDLESEQTLGHILIGAPDYGSTKTVAVSHSKDGDHYTEVGRYDFTPRKAEKCIFNFAPAPARYIRLTYVENNNVQNGFDRRFAFTTDVQAFAPVE